MGHVQRVLRDAATEQDKNRTKSNYRSTYHVSRTSNIVERLFSLSKDIMKPNMRQMDPSTLDSRLMLRLNDDLWDLGRYTILECMTDEATARANVTPPPTNVTETNAVTVLGRRARDVLDELDEDSA